MGSSVLKLLQTTRNFWLPLPVPSSEWLLPSPAMATTAMDTATATTSATAMDITDTTARGRLTPSPAMDTTAMDTATATTSATAMDTTDTTARGPLMLSPRLRPPPL